MHPLEYYDRSVNGAGVRTFSALLGIPPRGVPNVTADSEPLGRAQRIRLRGTGPTFPLPQLDAGQLTPLRHLFIHGSQATGDSCAFSDVDVVAILDDRRTFSADEHARCAQELRRLLGAIYTYDPLMHHGLSFYPASTLNAYDQSFLPVETLALAYPLYGGATLQLRTLPADTQRLRTRLRGSIEVLRRLTRERAYERGDYSYKQFLSNVLLLPALLLADHGHFVYKRDSFALVREALGEAAWAGIARAEELRAGWRRPPQSVAARTIGLAHPCLRVRWTRQHQPRTNTSRLTRTRYDAWERELERSFERVEALTA